MSIASWFGLNKDRKKFGPPSTINGVPISGPGSPYGSPGSDAPAPTPPPPPSATVAASEAQVAAETAGKRQRKKAMAGAPIVGGPLTGPNIPNKPWNTGTGGRALPRTLLGGK